MWTRGRLSLVTTYGFQPDLWNTKPPLLVWLMDICMTVFGPSEWALRLPSQVSAIGVLALVISFTRRVTGSMPAAALAAVLLSLSTLFFSEHGARTGDYEALLALLTTGYLYVLFFALHRRHAGLVRPLAVGGLLSLAIMTKGIAGALPGVGVVLYLALVGRWRRPLQTPWYAICGLAALVAPAAYLVLREQAAPGYLHAMLFNDVSGRFTRVLDRHGAGPFYYLDLVVDGGFSAGGLAALAPLALPAARGRTRLGLLYSLCVVGAMLTVLSFSATKLAHYMMPGLPFIAIAVGIAAHVALQAVARANAAGRFSLVTPRLLVILLAGVLGLTVVKAAYVRLVFLPHHWGEPQSLYGELFQDLAKKGLRAPRVVDGGIVRRGVVAEGVPSDYHPQLYFYRLLMNLRGMQVARSPPADLGRQLPGAVIATCDPDYAPRLRRLGPNLSEVTGCIAVRQPATRAGPSA